MKKLLYLLLFLSLGASAQQNPYVINNPHVIITGDLKVQAVPTRTTGNQWAVVVDSVSGLYKYIRTLDISGGGGGAVSSVFGRTGVITAQSGDYSAFYPLLTGSYTNPSWIVSLPYTKITGTPSSLPPSGSAGGDLTGTYPNPTVNIINSITKSFYDPTSSIQTQLNSKGSGTVTSFSKTDGFGAISSVTNPTTTPNYTLRIDSAHTTNGLMTFKFGASKGHIDSLFASTTINFSNQFKGNGSTLPIRVDSTQVQKAITLTTTGASGASTFNQATGALNIPNYAGSGSYTAGFGLKLTGTQFRVDTNAVVTPTTTDTLINKRVKNANAIATDLTTIEADGDSFTAGGGGITAWPPTFATLSGLTVDNNAVSGYTSAQVKDKFLLETSAQKARPHVFWVGRNDIFTKGADTIRANIATMVAGLGHNSYLILPVVNGVYGGEEAGGTNYKTIMALNKSLAAIYGKHYIDVRAYIISLYNTTNFKDLQNYGLDESPQTLRLVSGVVDSLHYNNTGQIDVANYLFASISVLLGNNIAVLSPDGLNSLFQAPTSIGVVSSSRNYLATSIFDNVNISTNGSLRQGDVSVFRTGSNGTYVGKYAGTQSAFTTRTLTNTAIGERALDLDTTGSENVAIGYLAMHSNISGNTNVAVGNGALGNNTSGVNNMAIGHSSLSANTTGGANVSIGEGALSSALTAFSNVGIGFHALQSATNGNNTAIGTDAGTNITTGGNNVVIGSEVSAQSATASNSLAIQNAIFGINNANTGTTVSTGNIGIYVTSPTARLSIPASSTGAASFNIPAGTAPTSPNHGDMWTDASHIYSRLAGVTYQLDQQSGGFTNPMTSVGDLILGTTAGAPSRLGIGTNGYFLQSNGTTASWTTGSLAYFDNTMFSGAGTSGSPLTLLNTGIRSFFSAGTGITITAGSVAVNSSQSIATLSNLTSNGPVYTSGGGGTLNVGTTTGSGTVYALATSPTFITPALGTPSALVLTNATGLPLGSTGVTGILIGTNGGTGVNNSTRTFTYGGNVIFSGANAVTITSTGTTNSTLPSGTHTLAGLDVAQTFSAGQTFNSALIAALAANNFYSPNTGGTGANSVTNTQYLVGGASTMFLRNGFYGSFSQALTTGAGYGANVFGNAPVTTFTSGTHALIANVVVRSPLITSGGATVTDVANLYSQYTAPTVGTGWNLWAKYGISRVSELQIDTLTASLAVYTDANKRLISKDPNTSLIVGTPTIVAGAGAGTAPTVSVTTNGKQLQVTVTTGTLPTGTNATIATVTLANALSYTPLPVFSSANGATALLNGASMVFMTSTGAANVTITSGTTALVAATTYLWNIAL